MKVTCSTLSRSREFALGQLTPSVSYLKELARTFVEDFDSKGSLARTDYRVHVAVSGGREYEFVVKAYPVMYYEVE